MSVPSTPSGPERVIELRRTFGQAFAAAPPVEGRPQDDLLAVRVGGDPYAIRQPEVAALLSDSQIARLPGSQAALLGLMGLRGALVPVYDLRLLLGYPRAPVPRWFLIAAAARVALAFDRFEGHLRVAREAVSTDAAPRAGNQSPYVQQVVRTDELVRPIIHLPSVLNQIAVLAHQRPGRKGGDS